MYLFIEQQRDIDSLLQSYYHTHARCFGKPNCNSVCNGVKCCFKIFVGVGFLRGGNVAMTVHYTLILATNIVQRNAQYIFISNRSSIRFCDLNHWIVLTFSFLKILLISSLKILLFNGFQNLETKLLLINNFFLKMAKTCCYFLLLRS